MRVSVHFCGSCLAGLLLGITGCGGSPPTPVHPVRGQVLFEGQPVPSALVVLHPVNPSAKDVPPPRAKVESDGSFTVGTFQSQDGAPAGDYIVTVSWWQSSAKGNGGRQDDTPPSNRLPPRYSQVSTSDLRAHVDAGNNQLPVIRLTK
jgi:hypothetical protein